MRIGVVGAGRIGGNLARLLTQAGHHVVISYARDDGELRARAAEFGCGAGSVADAAAFGDVVVLSVPWPNIDAVLAEAGSLAGKVVIDTTNHFTPAGLAGGLRDGTAAQANQARMPGARLVKAYNTLSRGVSAAASGRRAGPDRVVMFLCGDDELSQSDCQRADHQYRLHSVRCRPPRRRSGDGGSPSPGCGVRGRVQRGRRAAVLRRPAWRRVAAGTRTPVKDYG